MDLNWVVIAIAVVVVGFVVWRRVRGAAEAKQLIEAGALVVDVRSKAEFDSGHLAQAKHVPVDVVAQKEKAIEKWAGGKDQPIVVYCASGARSGRARAVLSAQGFTRVVNGGGYASLR